MHCPSNLALNFTLTGCQCLQIARKTKHDGRDYESSSNKKTINQHSYRGIYEKMTPSFGDPPLAEWRIKKSI